MTDYYLPYTKSNISKIALHAIFNDIILNFRNNIVELGAGSSTVLLQNLLKNYPFKSFVSLESNEKIYNLYSHEFEIRNLYNPIRLVNTKKYNQSDFYDHAHYPDLKDIDLLIIDGPMAFLPNQKNNRLAAFEHFNHRLNQNHCVVIDDADRLAEKKLIKLFKNNKYDNELMINNTIFLFKGKNYEILPQ